MLQRLQSGVSACRASRRGGLARPDASLQLTASGLPMIDYNSNAQRYRIIIRGECGRLLAGLLDGAQIEPSEGGDTCVVAVLKDDPEFYGLIEQLGDMALHIVSLQELDHDGGSASAT